MKDPILFVSHTCDETTLPHSLSTQFAVKTAQSAVEAYNLLLDQHFDVVIASHELPSMSGTEFLETIAQKHPNTQRILLTNGANPLDLIRAVNKAKIHAVALKPVQVNELLSLVNDAIQNVKKLLAKEKQIIELQTQNEQFEFILRQRLLS